MSVHVYKNTQKYSLTGAKVYYNGEWLTLNKSNKIFLDAHWERIGAWDSSIISSGQTGTSITVSSETSLTVLSGGTATDITVGYHGRMGVEGLVVSATIEIGGSMFISSGGTGTAIYTDGYLYISSGGTATDITATNLTTLHICIAPDTYIQGTRKGSAFEMKDAVISDFIIKYDRLIVMSGGTANSTTVDGGWLGISSGGMANSTTVNNGSMYVYSGGTATDIIWTPCIGNVTVDDEAYATFASNYSGVYFGSNNQLLSSAMTMNNQTIAGSWNVTGSMYVFSGGTANNTTVISSGSMRVYIGGTANNTTVISSGSMRVYIGGTANNTTVISSGRLYVSSGGTANSTTVISGGELDVYKSGSADTITVSSGGTLVVNAGGTATNVTSMPGAVVSGL